MSAQATELPEELEQKYAAKIAKLLNQAENPAATEEEAAAFMQKAAQLMLEYAIDEQMIDSIRGLSRDELCQDHFDYTGIYQYATLRVGSAVAKHFNLKCVQSLNLRGTPKYSRLHLTGFRSDVERARILDTSLQLQCAVALRAFNTEHKDRLALMDRGRSYRTRRDFVFGFAAGVSTKLAVAKRAAEREAATHEAERSNATATEATASVALVLVNRKERVDEYYDTVWGGQTRASRGRYAGGAAGGRDAGFAAGQRANTNTGAGIAGARGAIGR